MSCEHDLDFLIGELRRIVESRDAEIDRLRAGSGSTLAWAGFGKQLLAEIDRLRARVAELERAGSSRPAAIEWAIGRPLDSGKVSMRKALGVATEAEAREKLEAYRRWFAGLGHPDDDRAWRADIVAQMGLYWRPAPPEPEPWRPAAPAGEGGQPTPPSPPGDRKGPFPAPAWRLT